MDQDKLAYFSAKYRSMDRDALVELTARRATLAEEAVTALDSIVVERGLSPEPPLASHTIATNSTTWDAETIASETQRSRELWRGWLATICTFQFAITFIAAAQQILRKPSVSLGAIWAGLFVVVCGFAGYRIGKLITKKICADDKKSIAAKKRELWLLFWLMWPIYFVVFVLFSHL